VTKNLILKLKLEAYRKYSANQ